MKVSLMTILLNGVIMMYDLKKLEEKFHEYLKSRLKNEHYDFDKLKITEELLKQQEAFYMPFGHISYFLAIEDDEKPVLYVHASSRMDLDLIVFIDEEEYKEYDVWAGDHPDISKRYRAHARYVKPFKYDDLKFISDVER